ELAGKTLGVFGLGRIGKEVVKRALAFGMECIGYDVYWDEAFAQAHGVRRAASVEDLLRAADVISLHSNLSEETRGLINARTLALLKPDALLINTSRGELVEPAAVAAALE